MLVCIPEQVQGFFFVTGNGASACGFGIQSGDDVIRVSKCGGIPMTTKLFLNGDLTTRTKVFQEENGNKIKVCLCVCFMTLASGLDWV